MINSHEKFNLQEKGGAQWSLEVNWNPKDEKTNGCKVVKVNFPDGTSAFLKKEALYAVLFAIGTAEEQRKMVPQLHKKVRWFESVVSVKAKRDIAKGENITFPIKLSIPAGESESVGEVKRGGSRILAPR